MLPKAEHDVDGKTFCGIASLAMIYPSHEPFLVATQTKTRKDQVKICPFARFILHFTHIIKYTHKLSFLEASSFLFLSCHLSSLMYYKDG